VVVFTWKSLKRSEEKGARAKFKIWKGSLANRDLRAGFTRLKGCFSPKSVPPFDKRPTRIASLVLNWGKPFYFPFPSFKVNFKTKKGGKNLIGIPILFCRENFRARRSIHILDPDFNLIPTGPPRNPGVAKVVWITVYFPISSYEKKLVSFNWGASTPGFWLIGHSGKTLP